MKKMKFGFLLICCIIIFSACSDKENPSYLTQLVTEEDTILCGDYIEKGRTPTKEDICNKLYALDINFASENYIFEAIDNSKTELIWQITALSPAYPDFDVYQVGNYFCISCSYTAFDKLAKQEEKRDGYSPLSYGILVGCYDIGKAHIEKTDSKNIAKIENYLKEIFPSLSLDNYKVDFVHGDAGQNSYFYYLKDCDKIVDQKNWSFMWSSYSEDTNVMITVKNRNELTNLVYGEVFSCP